MVGIMAKTWLTILNQQSAHGWKQSIMVVDGLSDGNDWHSWLENCHLQQLDSHSGFPAVSDLC